MCGLKMTNGDVMMMIMKITVVLLIISNIIQWRCITGIIYDILKLERKMRYEDY